MDYIKFEEDGEIMTIPEALIFLYNKIKSLEQLDL